MMTLPIVQEILPVRSIISLALAGLGGLFRSYFNDPESIIVPASDKDQNIHELKVIPWDIEFFHTNRGRYVGIRSCPSAGGFGHFYQAGCSLAILYNPNTANKYRREYTIGSLGINLGDLLDTLNEKDPGWERGSSSIRSSRNGSMLSIKDIKTLIKKNC